MKYYADGLSKNRFQCLQRTGILWKKCKSGVTGEISSASLNCLCGCGK